VFQFTDEGKAHQLSKIHQSSFENTFPAMPKTKTKKEPTQEPIETQLWRAADKLRKNIDAAEYKHIVLGLVFLKYISDAFVELYDKLKAEESSRRRPRGQGRVQGRERLLRAARRAVGFSAKPRQAAHHRQNGG
jgi:hypothetical protein